MDFLTKIETLINGFLTKFIALFTRALARLLPRPVKVLYRRCSDLFRVLIQGLRRLPLTLKDRVITTVGGVKSTLAGLDFKSRLLGAYTEARERFSAKGPGRLTGIKGAVATPFVIMGKWLQGLSATQSLILLTFTASSFLAGLSVISSGQRLVKGGPDAERAPASSETEDLYERPSYYKENSRHFSITNLRLPVYVGEVNELRSVDVDFTATVTTRRARKILEQKEFQLRDHLLTSMEPIIAAFPLSDEGKEVVKHKLHQEIDLFLKENNVPARVVKLRLTYILAN